MATTLILIDAKNALYRFGFAHNTLTNSEGVPTGAVYGILGAFMRLKAAYPDSKLVLVWDGRGKSWRHKYYTGYKSNRTADKEKPPEARAVLEQMPLIKKVATMLDIPQMEVPTVEADDLIGIAAIMHRAFGLPAVVYSSDKDFMQLMAAGITIIRPKPFSSGDAGKRLDPETAKSVLKQFGCKPEDILKVRAYAGDKSDAIPVAIPGIGEKRALTCIQAGADPSKEWTEALVPVSDRVTDIKLRIKLEQHWTFVRRNYRLMQIACFPDPALFGEETVREIKNQLSLASKKPSSVEWDSYWAFVKFLLDLDLLEALENRIHLWQIARDISLH